MKTFRFPLEPLRVLRRQKERVAQQRYARLLTASNTAAVQLEKATGELARGREVYTRELNEGVTAARIMNLRTWCMALEIHQHERRAAFTEARRISQVALNEMNGARREREGLDRFYEKARRAHARETLREEQKNFDELAVQMAGAGLLQSSLADNLSQA
ncbi:MAG TPA: flagellar export protein FliJ [Verrucomicrobiae bacterium]|jgi:flagellar export protein FliJ|nr:flagellar export protein FliJ [Verrucomicrobiae bacterium]